MSDQSPRLIPFFLSLSIFLPPLLLLSLLSFYLSLCFFLSTLVPLFSLRLALFYFCFLFPSLLPSYPCFLFLLPFLSPACLTFSPLSPFFFLPSPLYPFFLSSLFHPFSAILLHFLVPSSFVHPLPSACHPLHTFMYFLSPLFTQLHSSAIFGSSISYPCSPFIHAPHSSMLYLSQHLLWLRFISPYVLFFISNIA